MVQYKPYNNDKPEAKFKTFILAGVEYDKDCCEAILEAGNTPSAMQRLARDLFTQRDAALQTLSRRIANEREQRAQRRRLNESSERRLGLRTEARLLPSGETRLLSYDSDGAEELAAANAVANLGQQPSAMNGKYDMIYH